MRLFSYLSIYPRHVKILPRSVRGASLVFFLYLFGWALFDPFLPIYFKELLASYTNVSIVFSAFYLFSLFLYIPFGHFADIVSKKRLMQFMLFLYLPFGPILGILATPGHFIFFRAYHAFLATGLWSSAEAYVRFHSPHGKTSESIGLFNSAEGIAGLFGALIGGIIITFTGIRVLFFIMPLFVLSAMLVARRLPDHHGKSNLVYGVSKLFKQSIFRAEIKDFFSAQRMPFITFLSFAATLVYALTVLMLPLVSDYLGATPWEIGLIYAIFITPLMLQAPFALIADRCDRKKLLLAGSGVAFVVQICFLLTNNILFLFGLAFALALTFAFLNPIIEGMATAAMPKNRIGQFNGVYRAIGLTAGAVGTFAAGPIADAYSLQAAFLTGAFVMAIFFGSVFVKRSAFFANQQE